MNGRSGTPRRGEFEYVFPAIRGVQAGREYYSTMFPLRMIPRLFSFDDEELLPEQRAQRTLNRSRVPEMARYIVENPDSYVFSALTASVSTDVEFDAITDDAGPSDRIGTLRIPMDTRFVINDGQHRRAAIEEALTMNPEIGDETISIVLFIDVGLARCQQMFADLNRYAVRPARSISVLYDHRDDLSAVTRMAVFSSDFYRDLTETETSNLAARSRKLFTLSAMYNANRALLDGVDEETLEKRAELVGSYWSVVAKQFPEWGQVRAREVTAGEIRRDFIHSHGIVLHALGKVGNALIERGRDKRAWERALRPLREIDWHRANSELWEGRALSGGRVSKSTGNVLLTTALLRTRLNLPLPDDEQKAENNFRRGDSR